jgi:hypothetical protein
MEKLPPEMLRKIASSLPRKNRLSLSKALGGKKKNLFFETPRTTAKTPYRTVRKARRTLGNEGQRIPTGRRNILFRHPLNTKNPTAYKNESWNSYILGPNGPVFFNKMSKNTFRINKKTGRKKTAVYTGTTGNRVKPRKNTNTWSEYLRRLEKHKAYIRGEPERRKLMNVIENAMRENRVTVASNQNRNKWVRTGMLVLNNNGAPWLTNKAVKFYEAKRYTL